MLPHEKVFQNPNVPACNSMLYFCQLTFQAKRRPPGNRRPGSYVVGKPNGFGKGFPYIYMAGVQNSWSKGLYKVGTIGIEKLILHLRYEAGPIGNDAVHKLGASVALVEL